MAKFTENATPMGSQKKQQLVGKKSAGQKGNSDANTQEQQHKTPQQKTTPAGRKMQQRNGGSAKTSILKTPSGKQLKGQVSHSTGAAGKKRRRVSFVDSLEDTPKVQKMFKFEPKDEQNQNGKTPPTKKPIKKEQLDASSPAKQAVKKSIKKELMDTSDVYVDAMNNGGPKPKKDNGPKKKNTTKKMAGQAQKSDETSNGTNNQGKIPQKINAVGEQKPPQMSNRQRRRSNNRDGVKNVAQTKKTAQEILGRIVDELCGGEAEGDGTQLTDQPIFYRIAAGINTIFKFGHHRALLLPAKLSAGDAKTIIEFAARLQPKQFKNAPHPEKGEAWPMKQANALWTLSAVFCLLAHAFPEGGGDESAEATNLNLEEGDGLRKQYLDDAKELRKMAKDLVTVQSQTDFDHAPLIDLIIALCSRRNQANRCLAIWIFGVICAKLPASSIQPIIEVLGKTNPFGGEEAGEGEEEDIGNAALKDSEVESDDEESAEEGDSESDDEEDEEDDTDSDDEGEGAEVNPRLVEDLRKALGTAGFDRDLQEVAEGEEKWNLSDKQMFILDRALASAFRRNSATASQRQQEQLYSFRLRLVDLLHLYVGEAHFEQALHIYIALVKLAVNHLNHECIFKIGQLHVLLSHRKKECKPNPKKLVALAESIFEKSPAVTEQRKKNSAQSGAQKRTKGRDVAIQTMQFLFSYSADHKSETASPEMAKFMRTLLADYFAGRSQQSRTIEEIQLYALNRLSDIYPAYLCSHMLAPSLQFAFDTSVDVKKRTEALAIATNLVHCPIRAIQRTDVVTAFGEAARLLASHSPAFLKVAEATKKTTKKTAKEEVLDSYVSAAEGVKRKMRETLIYLLCRIAKSSGEKEKLVLRKAFQGAGLTLKTLDPKLHDAMLRIKKKDLLDALFEEEDESSDDNDENDKSPLKKAKEELSSSDEDEEMEEEGDELDDESELEDEDGASDLEDEDDED